MTGQPILNANSADICKLGFGTWKLKGEDATRAVEAALATGYRHIDTAWLGEAVACSDAPLAVNQVEYHPFLDQTPVLDAVRDYAMGLKAYCPIAQGRVFEEPVLKEIAETHGKSPAQIALKWLIDQDQVAAIPRSSNPEHIRSNFEIFDITLSPEETRRISALKSSTDRLIDPSWAPAWDVAA